MSQIGAEQRFRDKQKSPGCNNIGEVTATFEELSKHKQPNPSAQVMMGEDHCPKCNGSAPTHFLVLE